MSVEEAKYDSSRLDPMRSCRSCRIAQSVDRAYQEYGSLVSAINAGGQATVQVYDTVYLGQKITGPVYTTGRVTKKSPSLIDAGNMLLSACYSAATDCNNARRSDHLCPQESGPQYSRYPDTDMLKVLGMKDVSVKFFNR